MTDKIDIVDKGLIPMDEQLHNKLVGRLPEWVWKLMADNPTMPLAGGALRDGIMGVTPTDYDFYVGTRLAALNIVGQIDMQPTTPGPHSIDHPTGASFIFGWGSILETVLQKFDFTVNMIAINKTRGLIHERTLADIAAKGLYIPDPGYNLFRPRRFEKMLRKGFMPMIPFTEPKGPNEKDFDEAYASQHAAASR